MCIRLATAFHGSVSSEYVDTLFAARLRMDRRARGKLPVSASGRCQEDDDKQGERDWRRHQAECLKSNGRCAPAHEPQGRGQDDGDDVPAVGPE